MRPATRRARTTTCGHGTADPSSQFRANSRHVADRADGDVLEVLAVLAVFAEIGKVAQVGQRWPRWALKPTRRPTCERGGTSEGNRGQIQAFTSTPQRGR